MANLQSHCSLLFLICCRTLFTPEIHCLLLLLLLLTDDDDDDETISSPLVEIVATVERDESAAVAACNDDDDEAESFLLEAVDVAVAVVAEAVSAAGVSVVVGNKLEII